MKWLSGPILIRPGSFSSITDIPCLALGAYADRTHGRCCKSSVQTSAQRMGEPFDDYGQQQSYGRPRSHDSKAIGLIFSTLNSKEDITFKACDIPFRYVTDE